MNSEYSNPNENLHATGKDGLISEPKYVFNCTDRLMAWAALLLGYLFIRVLPVSGNSLGAALFLLLLWGSAFAWLRLSGIKPTLRALIFSGCAVAMIPAFIVTSDTTATGWLYFGELAAFMYFISCAGGNSIETRLGGRFWVDALRSAVIVPFTAIDAQLRALIPGKNESTGRRIIMTLLWILLGLCAAVIPTLVVIALLSFDDSFMRLFESFRDIKLGWLTDRLFALILGIPFAVFGYAALTASKTHRGSGIMSAESCEKAAGAVRVLPSALVCAAMTPVLAVYMLFFISQWDMYMSAFTGVLPEGIIYSDYARKGFFELCVISALNAAVLIGVGIFVQQKSKTSRILLKIYTIVTSLFTLILIATAISKMALYIGAYGLTLKRLHASWLMLLLAAAFVLTIVKQLMKKLRFTPALLICGAVFFAALAYGNAGGMVADYNADAYLDGRLDGVDLEELYSMGDSGIPALLRVAFESEEPEVRERAERYIGLYKQSNADRDDGIFSFSIPRARAVRQLEGHY